MKISKWFVFGVLCALLLSACAPATAFAQKVIELPSPIQIAILTGVTYVFGLLLAKVAEKWPKLAEWLGPYLDEAAIAVAGAIVLAIQNYLNAVPPQWEGVAGAVVALAVEILAAVGLLKSVQKATFTFAAWKLAKSVDKPL